MFLLPNNKKIDEDGIIDAMLDTDLSLRYVLDTNTGEVGCIERSGQQKSLEPPRYIEIPRVLSVTQLKWLKECMDFCMEERALREELEETMHRGEADAFEQCEKILSEDESGWIHSWREWQGTGASEEMLKWFSTLPFDIEDKFEGCGDCELCKLMEQGEHSIGDFMEAAAKEKRKNPPPAQEK